MRYKILVSICVLLTFLPALAGSADDADKKGVYEYVVREVTLELDAAAAALEKKIEESSYELVARLNSGVPEDCTYRARVFVLNDPVYAAKLIKANPQTGPFAVPLRINLFEDEQGLHAAIVNPVNVNRTILLDDAKYSELAESARTSLRALVADAVPGQASDKPFGPIRKKGYIGRTMGVMAGGPFDGKIKVVHKAPGTDLDTLIESLQAGINEGEGKWNMGLAYTLVLEDQKVAVLGLGSNSMEAKSFLIVKEGSDSNRKKLACPGLAHAAAYPIEVVVALGDEGIEIKMVEAMYRMKMFFEDAGKWAFMKNMGMPGSISDEMEGRIEASL